MIRRLMDSEMVCLTQYQAVAVNLVDFFFQKAQDTESKLQSLEEKYREKKKQFETRHDCKYHYISTYPVLAPPTVPSVGPTHCTMGDLLTYNSTSV